MIFNNLPAGNFRKRQIMPIFRPKNEGRLLLERCSAAELFRADRRKSIYFVYKVVYNLLPV